MSAVPHVVVVGAGFGGLRAAVKLSKVGASVTLVDPRNYHLFQPLLYQVATGGLDQGDIAYPLRGIVRRRPQVTVRMASVTQVDPVGRVASLDTGEQLVYDHLVLAAGAITNDFGVPGVAEHGFGLKTLEDAIAVRGHMLRCFEQADADPDLVDQGWLTVVTVGGGPTGVEFAGAVAELFNRILKRDFPQLRIRRARVVLVETLDRLLPSFSPASQRHAQRQLRRRGVDVRTGATVKQVTASAVHLDDGEIIAARTLLWAAGVKAVDVPLVLDVERTRGGRIVVAPDGSVPGHEGLWVIGDVAAFAGEDGQLLPQVAPVAQQQGRHVARQILRHHRGETTQPFSYFDRGSMATIGRGAAVADLPLGIHLRGFLGWLAWLGLHLVTLMGFRNRLSVFVNWSWNYVRWEGGNRLILASPPPQGPQAAQR